MRPARRALLAQCVSRPPTILAVVALLAAGGITGCALAPVSQSHPHAAATVARAMPSPGASVTISPDLTPQRYSTRVVLQQEHPTTSRSTPRGGCS